MGQQGWRLAVVGCTLLLFAAHISEIPANTIRTFWQPRIAAGVVALFGSRASRSDDVFPVGWCVRGEEDGELLATASKSEENAVVIVAPDVSYEAQDCENMWWLARHPIQTISKYAVYALPGQAHGPLRELLTKRRIHFMNIDNIALNAGRLSWSDVLEISASLRPGHVPFVLAPKSLAVAENPRAQKIGESPRFVLFKITD
jgi:hypothetical protein